MTLQIYLLLFALVLIDYATGTLSAILEKSFSSAKMREGLAHKATYGIAIAMAEIVKSLSASLDLGFTYSLSLTLLVSIWITITEVGSILENLVKINPELKDNAFMQIFSRKDTK